jgi:hypothetical protein
MNLNNKEILGLLSVLILTISYLPYYVAILKGTAKPHIFTWLVWSLITGIAFAAQLYEKAGPGSWLMEISCALCVGVTILAVKKGEKTITISDWCSFIFALTGLPLWYFTKDPMWSVILISIVDGLGFYPTFRKSWDKPYDESALFFTGGSISVLFALAALEHVNINTALYLFSVFLFDSVFVVLLLYRRRYHPVTKES